MPNYDKYKTICTFYNIRIMNKQIGKAQLLQGDVITSGDYEQGLRVLAKLIARLHLKKTSHKKENGGTHDIRKR